MRWAACIGNREYNRLKIRRGLMIRRHGSAVPAQGKWREAVQFVTQVAAVVNKIAPEANVQAMSTKYGDTGVHWYSDAASVGALDLLWDRIETDPRYNEANVKMGGPRDFMADSERTLIYETTQA